MKKYKVKDWLPYYIETYKKPYVSFSTWYSYCSVTRLYILPRFGEEYLHKLKALDLQQFLNDLYFKVPRQARNSYIIFKASIRKAIELGILNKNVFIGVIFKTKFSSTARALTNEEQQCIISYLKRTNSDLLPLIQCYITTGLRRSEALSIRKQDLVLKSQQLVVHGTKTANSYRIIPLNKQVFNYIKHNVSDIPYNFTTRYVNKKFKQVCDTLGIQGITIHSLRHTFATRCLEQGIPVKLVQKWLGHSKYSITAELYSHILSDYEIEKGLNLKFDI
ncbi:MAG: site-specific integrase [Clostridia bacterium]|nr:site-specific integrase [Clostridia bacterium]